ncbi:hypothetical protein GCM10022419_021480 [Nonomuraea rosea]|uniref:Uncharacterized protein n=1 Tax=Nonomuraea rosea TaxID=638574 RepID=A0ABP6VVF0_9ACTN
MSDIGPQSPDVPVAERPVVTSPGDPDVYLDVPMVKVEEIDLEVQDLRAKVSLQAEVLDLLRLNVGADVGLGRVSLTIKGVEAQALLKVRLDNVAHIIDRVLQTIDDNPQILDNLTRSVGTAVENIGTGAGYAVRDVGAGAGTAVRDVGAGAGTAVRDVGAGAGTAVRDVGAGVHEVGAGAGTAVRDVGTSTAGTIRDVGPGAGQVVRDTGAGATGIVRDTGTSATGIVRDTGTTAARTAAGQFVPRAGNDAYGVPPTGVSAPQRVATENGTGEDREPENDEDDHPADQPEPDRNADEQPPDAEEADPDADGQKRRHERGRNGHERDRTEAEPSAAALAGALARTSIRAGREWLQHVTDAAGGVIKSKSKDK